jgi:hypothetical protein
MLLELNNVGCNELFERELNLTFKGLDEKLGNSELLELRLLETGFLSRFQLNP